MLLRGLKGRDELWFFMYLMQPTTVLAKQEPLHLNKGSLNELVQF